MNKKKSIALLTFAGLPMPAVRGGAVETLIDNICAQNEEENRICIDVYSIFDDDAKTAAESLKNTEYIYYRTQKGKRLSIKNILFKTTGICVPNKTMRSVVNQINKKEYDAVYITSIFRELYYIAKQINSKVVWYLHGDALTVLPSETCKKIANECAAVVSVSDFVGEQMRKSDCCVPIYTVKNCTDLAPIEYFEREPKRAEFLQRYGISTDNTVFLYVGRINPIKGIKELVSAFEAIDNKKVSLMIAGEPQNATEKEYFESIKKIADERVVFIGYVKHSELADIYNACDAVVVSSICNEAAPLVVLEAQMCGKYVIATNRGGIPEYATERATLVDTDEQFEDNLSKAMSDFAYNPTRENTKDNIVRTQRELYADFIAALDKIV